MHSEAAIVFHVTRSVLNRCPNRTVIVKPSRSALSTSATSTIHRESTN